MIFYKHPVYSLSQVRLLSVLFKTNLIYPNVKFKISGIDIIREIWGSKLAKQFLLMISTLFSLNEDRVFPLMRFLEYNWRQSMKGDKTCKECGQIHQLPSYQNICQYCQKGKKESEITETRGHVTQCLECSRK